MNKILNDFKNLVFSGFGVMMLSFLSGIITARFMGVSERGIYTYQVKFSELITTFVCMGLPASYQYFINKGKLGFFRLLNHLKIHIINSFIIGGVLQNTF